MDAQNVSSVISVEPTQATAAVTHIPDSGMDKRNSCLTPPKPIPDKEIRRLISKQTVLNFGRKKTCEHNFLFLRKDSIK